MSTVVDYLINVVHFYFSWCLVERGTMGFRVISDTNGLEMMEDIVSK